MVADGEVAGGPSQSGIDHSEQCLAHGVDALQWIENVCRRNFRLFDERFPLAAVSLVSAQRFREKTSPDAMAMLAALESNSATHGTDAFFLPGETGLGSLELPAQQAWANGIRSQRAS